MMEKRFLEEHDLLFNIGPSYWSVQFRTFHNQTEDAADAIAAWTLS